MVITFWRNYERRGCEDLGSCVSLYPGPGAMSDGYVHATIININVKYHPVISSLMHITTITTAHAGRATDTLARLRDSLRLV